MENPQSSEPSVEELVAKALTAKVIDPDFAQDLRGSTDLNEALGMFYTYVLDNNGDPDALLAEWGITEQKNDTPLDE